MDLQEIQRRFGSCIRRRRILAGMSLEKLAGQAGVHRTSLSLIEQGKQVPSLAIVFKLATALGVKMSELLAEAEADTPPEQPAPLPQGRPRRKKEK